MRVLVIAGRGQVLEAEKVAMEYAALGDEVRRVRRDHKNAILQQSEIWQSYTNIIWADKVVVLSEPDIVFSQCVEYELTFALFNAKPVVIVNAKDYEP